jgi:hypothetical protein
MVFTCTIVWHSNGHKLTQWFGNGTFSSSGEVVREPYSVGSVRKAIKRIGLALSNGPNRIGVSHPSPDDGNLSRFSGLVFFTTKHEASIKAVIATVSF